MAAPVLRLSNALTGGLLPFVTLVLTINQLAERWQVSTKHIYNLKEYGLVATQLGKALRYHIDDVRAFEKRSRR